MFAYMPANALKQCIWDWPNLHRIQREDGDALLRRHISRHRRRNDLHLCNLGQGIRIWNQISNILRIDETIGLLAFFRDWLDLYRIYREKEEWRSAMTLSLTSSTFKLRAIMWFGPRNPNLKSDFKYLENWRNYWLFFERRRPRKAKKPAESADARLGVLGFTLVARLRKLAMFPTQHILINFQPIMMNLGLYLSI